MFNCVSETYLTGSEPFFYLDSALTFDNKIMKNIQTLLVNHFLLKYINFFQYLKCNGVNFTPRQVRNKQNVFTEVK